MGNHEDLLDIKQAAKVLNVTETSLRRWTNAGQLACVRVGAKRERRFRRSDLLAFLEDQPVRLSVIPSGEPIGNTVVGGVPLAHGTHLCSFYTSDAGRTKLAVGFLADGLKQDSACHVLAPRTSAREVLAQLEQHVPSIQKDIDAGRLMVYEYGASSSAQLESVETRLIASLRNGARAIRLVGNVSESPLGHDYSIDHLVQYEQDWDRLIAKRFPLVTLCQYDARRYSGVELCKVLNCHHDAFRYPPERMFL
jgi:transcriptional repressor of dcmA and dcmR